MTNEEAREIMSKLTFYWEVGEQTLTQNQINEALDLAIKALEHETILDKIRAEIKKAVWEDVIASLDGTDEVRIPRLNPDDVFEIIDKYNAESEDKYADSN